jgi:hypothetical protein
MVRESEEVGGGMPGTPKSQDPRCISSMAPVAVGEILYFLDFF